MGRPEDMYQCQTVNCGRLYDPEQGDKKRKVPQGTLFQDLSDDWRCPVCGATKKSFRPCIGPGSVKEDGPNG